MLAGSNVQRRGSSTTPSLTPSSASQVASVALWIAASLLVFRYAPGVFQSACSFQTKPAKRWDQSFAGAPTVTIIEIISKEQGIKCDAQAIANLKEKFYIESLENLEPIHQVVAIARYKGVPLDFSSTELLDQACASYFALVLPDRS